MSKDPISGQSFLDSPIDYLFKVDNSDAKRTNSGWYIYTWASPLKYTIFIVGEYRTYYSWKTPAMIATMEAANTEETMEAEAPE